MPRGATVRLFAALLLPLQVRGELAAWGRACRGAWRGDGRPGGVPRVLAPESLHLTLCFLGSRPQGEVEPLAEAIESLQHGPLEISAGGPLLLPRRRPKVLAVSVGDPGGELAALQAAVSGALRNASGWVPEHRRFTPHVTVARMRGTEGPPAELAPTPDLRFAPEAVVLYRSILDPDGARHEALATHQLA